MLFYISLIYSILLFFSFHFFPLLLITTVMTMFMLSFIFHFFVIVCDLFKWKPICACFFIFCLYLYCCWRSNYQENWHSIINQFNHTWISIGICHGLFCVQWSEVRGSSFILLILLQFLNHYCLNFLYIIEVQILAYLLWTKILLTLQVIQNCTKQKSYRINVH